MKNVHHISAGWLGNPFRVELESLGFPFDEGYAVLEIEEVHEKWSAVARLVKKYSVSDRVTSKFSETEIAAAQYVELRPSWHHGYPQPSSNFGYRSITYDDSNSCRICNCGLVQRAPFRLRGEPRWGRRSFMQLNWFFDEYFVRPEVWGAFLQPLGIACREVYSKGEKKLDTVVQMVIPQTDIGHYMGEHRHEVCDACGTIRYLPFTQGMFPPLRERCDRPVFKSREYFGSGGSSHRAVIASKEFCAVIRNNKLRGVDFYPFAEDG